MARFTKHKTGFLFSILVLLWSIPALATHQRAAEITFRHIEGYTYEITLITYTFTPSPADRPTLDVLWGDGTMSTLLRTEKINLPNLISRNVYRYVPDVGATTARHTYPGPGIYNISMEDPNRNYGVINIPNSVNTPIYVETQLLINPFLGVNNSPELLNPPVDNGCTGQPFYHNTGAYDPDGDSLSYALIYCRGVRGYEVNGYTFPDASESFSLDPVSGELEWKNPVMQGEYNIAILVEEWRSGVRIGYVTRDMQINIVACDHEPPIIESLDDTCILAGTYLEFPVHGIDPDAGIVSLSASGGPFEQSTSPAFFEEVSAPFEVWGLFQWQSICRHVRKLPYQVYIKATDNGEPVNLVKTKTINIKVIAPAPENIQCEALGQSTIVKWNQSICTNAIGYKLYRKNGPYEWEPGYCETGIPNGSGYKLVHEAVSIEDTSFMDDDQGQGLTHGILYCYRVIALFADGAESYASEESCVSLKKDVPVITNVSILKTDNSNGKIHLAWSKPTEIDEIQAPGPYKYIISRKKTTDPDFEVLDSLSLLNDTIYSDTKGLNTFDNSWAYRIDFYNDSPSERFLIGKSKSASSEFLTINSSDEALELSWQSSTPWVSDSFNIYRKEEGQSEFEFLSHSKQRMFRDEGLINHKQYCYYIEAIGSYGTPGFVEPIINFSQEHCARPYDNEPPCPPILNITTYCDEADNELTWTNPNHFCASDVEKYYIYYKMVITDSLQIIDSIAPATDTIFLHENLPTIAGCYAVSALDSNRNESQLSNIICVSMEACPGYSYQLPNVFTPNGDGYNDYFIPFPYVNVERAEIEIFNRWGAIVYKSSDPEILWDGKHYQSNSDCAEGSYFYISTVWEYHLNGLSERQIKGAVQLLRGKQ